MRSRAHLPSPLQWSSESLIFSAHPSKPLLVARHFSSSRQFFIPSPNPVASAQSAYLPPTLISVAPQDDALFAYFPKNNGEGIGCRWKRGSQIDSWAVQEWWSFPSQAAPIAAEWLGARREVSHSRVLPRLLPHSSLVDNRQPRQARATPSERLLSPDPQPHLDTCHAGLPRPYLLLSVLPSDLSNIKVSSRLNQHVSI
jgi:hypothetical protein